MSEKDMRTNPKGDSDAGLGSKGESVFRAATLMKSASRADLMSDADKWVRRGQVVAGVLIKMGDSKKGRAALQEIFYPQSVDREEEREESKLESSIGVEDTQGYDFTPDEIATLKEVWPFPDKRRAWLRRFTDLADIESPEALDMIDEFMQLSADIDAYRKDQSTVNKSKLGIAFNLLMESLEDSDDDPEPITEDEIPE